MEVLNDITVYVVGRKSVAVLVYIPFCAIYTFYFATGSGVRFPRYSDLQFGLEKTISSMENDDTINTQTAEARFTQVCTTLCPLSLESHDSSAN